MTTDKRQFLSSLLEVALQKMKWDVDTDADDLDDDERAAFEGMRKVRPRRVDLRVKGMMSTRVLTRVNRISGRSWTTSTVSTRIS